MKQEHLYSSDDKLKWWDYGEWVEEPDKVEFEHNGIECKVIRIACKEPYAKEFHMFGGHLCGYIKVPDDHSCYGKKYDDIEIDCHGGLTYSEMDNENHDYMPKKGHWIGFDCAHSGDILPSAEILRKRCKYPMESFYKEMKEKYQNCELFNPTYKNINYCVEECKSMADQLINMVEA